MTKLPFAVNKPLYVSVRQASILTGLHDQTIRTYIKQGKLPARKIGRKLLIPTSALTTFETKSEAIA